MKIGSKSILFGAHCFFLHPFFVAYSWWKLYGFPCDIRLWVAFFVHDLGYFGKPNMDGAEGELHPYFGANVMHWLFDKTAKSKIGRKAKHKKICKCNECNYWFYFTLHHSRFLAKKNNAQYSRLCVADKFALVNTPAWLYLPMVKATGEIKEYMKDAERNSNGELKVQGSESIWYAQVQDYVRRWVAEHKEIKEDTWTTASRENVGENGVWK